MASQQPSSTSQSLFFTGIADFANYDFKCLDPNPVELYLAQLSPNGRETMTRALFRVLEVLALSKLDATIQRCQQSGKRKYAAIFEWDWTQLTYSDLMHLRAELLQQFSRKTADQALNAVRRVLEEAFCAGHIAQDHFEQITALPRLPIHEPSAPSGRAVTLDEVKALLNQCTGALPRHSRDGALIAVLAGLGLRSCEVISLQLSDYDPVNHQLHIHGKGGKQRTLPLNSSIVSWLERWLANRGDSSGPLFYGNDWHGNLVERPISRAALSKVIRLATEASGTRLLSPHDFRRGFITDVLQTEHLFTVTHMAGHCSPNTTRHYDHRPFEILRQAAALIDLDIAI